MHPILRPLEEPYLEVSHCTSITVIEAKIMLKQQFTQSPKRRYTKGAMTTLSSSVKSLLTPSIITMVMRVGLLGFIALGCGDYWTKDKIAGPDDGGVEENGGVNPTAFYARDVQPILDAKCVICHGSLGGLALTSYDGLIAGGDSGPGVTSGDVAGSLLVKRIDGTIPPLMPVGVPLSDQEIELIKTWIGEGALNN